MGCELILARKTLLFHHSHPLIPLRLEKAETLNTEKEITGRKRPLIPTRREISEYGQARHPYTIPLVLELWFVLVPLSEEKNRFVYKPTKESVAGGSFIFSPLVSHLTPYKV